MKQIMAKKYTELQNLPQRFLHSFGQLSIPFIAIVWGKSGHGKTNLLMELMEMLAPYGSLLYGSLEEGHEKTIQNTLLRHFEGKAELLKNIKIADHELTYPALVILLKKKRSARFVIIDSIQYLNITYADYKELKQMFPSKSFLFISHAQGREPHGATAKSIRYDAGIKIHVEKYLAFPVSRYGGNMPFVIWEDGAKRLWGTKQYKKFITTPKPTKQ